MYQRVITSLALSTLLCTLAACPAPRTAAASQTTVTAFDATASDEKALAAVDEMAAALGGAEAWAGVKQLRWEVKHVVNGKMTEYFRHSWDLWNGRHRFEFAPDPSMIDPDNPEFHMAMYDMFKSSGGYVASTKQPDQKAPSSEVKRVVELARKVWQRDAYQLAMFHKLKDPGVKLGYAGERKDFFGTCTAGCIDVTVKFDPAIGTDEYHVLINKESKLPEAFEKAIPGGKMAVKVVKWSESGGLKFPSVMENLGAPEVFNLENIEVGTPNDDLYVPPVTH